MDDDLLKRLAKKCDRAESFEVWDTKEAKKKHALPDCVGHVRGVAFAAHDDTLTSVGGHTIRFRNSAVSWAEPLGVHEENAECKIQDSLRASVFPRGVLIAREFAPPVGAPDVVWRISLRASVCVP